MKKMILLLALPALLCIAASQANAKGTTKDFQSCVDDVIARLQDKKAMKKEQGADSWKDYREKLIKNTERHLDDCLDAWKAAVEEEDSADYE